MQSKSVFLGAGRQRSESSEICAIHELFTITLFEGISYALHKTVGITSSVALYACYNRLACYHGAMPLALKTHKLLLYSHDYNYSRKVRSYNYCRDLKFLLYIIGQRE